MKFTVSMKDPDSLQDAISDAVDAELALLPDLDQEEHEAMAEIRRKKAAEIASRWFKWGEYVSIKIDTVAGTAVVVPVNS